MTVEHYKQNMVVEGILLIFVDGDYGGYYIRADGRELDYNECLVCGEELRGIAPQDFAAFVCLNHEPPIIYNKPWCNSQSIERRELYEHEYEHMEAL